jgi:hypothetical protein
LWVIKVWFFVSTLVLKIATFAKPETLPAILQKNATE